jgi:cation diffusion facilitator family transporter
MIVTAAAMVIEIVVGSVTHSMALLADGWHMATHVGALAVASASYWVARRYATRNTFGFGTGKISALAGYTNALALGAVAIVMLIESVQRFSSAAPIDFATSLPVAVGGLAVNVLSIWILQDDHDEHDHHHHHDHNHRAVALHVVADAFTSALAIAALGIGYATGIQWLDALTGIVGACAIMHWVATLCRHTSCELLDLDPAGALQQEVRARLQQIDDVRVLDLHVWSIGRGQHGCVATLIASAPRTPDDYRQRVLAIPRVAHVTIEVRRCHGDHANEQAVA